MKNFLAVDTSGNHLTVIASKNGKTSAVFLPNCAMRHAVSVMNAIDEALNKAELSPKDCDFFSAVVGAGSFTGIRIGISAIKGFCLAYGKPSLAVTSFDVAAYNTKEGKILCLVDALHDCYYACGYENGRVCLEPAYLEEAEVLALVNEGYTPYACSVLPIASKTEVKVVDPCEGLEKAVKALSAENRFGELTALYVRKSSAELNLNK